MFKVVGLFAFALAVVNGIDNGIGRTPPRGWRSFNQFTDYINQSLIERQYAKLVERSRTVDGMKMSLLDLGYVTAGIDDSWQACGSGPGGVGFHNKSGFPIVNETRFPDMRAMTTKAKELGLKPGWYGNNCECREERPSCQMSPNGSGAECFAGDVAATLYYGFESIKLDGCGVQRNITEYARLFNQTGVPVMLENCHNHHPYNATRDPVTKMVDCPMNFFRTSTDIRPTFGSILINLQTTSKFNGEGLTGPGCFGYPDMLEVGVTNSQKTAVGCTNTLGQPNCTLNFVEARTHFSAWCIVSSPLVLGFDLTDNQVMDEVWEIISNREALLVNEAWNGDAGVLVSKSKSLVHMTNCSWFNDLGCDHPEWMVWAKGVAPGKVACLLMNNGDRTKDVLVNFKSDLGLQECATSGCSVRDIHNHRDLGRFKGGFTAKNLMPHDSAFIIVTTTN
jgi:alpha-galactosidase